MNMKKIIKRLLLVLIIVSILVGALFSVPSQQAHHDALQDVMGRVASQVAQEKTSGIKDVLKTIGLGNEEKTKKGYDKLGKALAPTLVKMVKVNDYLLFSVGKLDYEGTLYPVSLGIFGHVFILPLDKIQAALAEGPAIPTK